MYDKIIELFNHLVIRKNDNDFRRQNEWVLYSSYFYLLPALYILFTPLKKYTILAFIAFMQLFLSIFSDYTFVEDNGKLSQVIQSVDRVNSIIYTIYIICLIYSNYEIPSILYVCLTIILIEYSRKSQNQEEWVKRHSIWHVSSSIILLLTLYEANSRI